jgi:hypothetical protein
VVNPSGWPADDDLIVWEKYPGNPVVTLKNHGALQVDEWHDHFLFREAGRTYMVCGANINSKRGRAAPCSCTKPRTRISPSGCSTSISPAGKLRPSHVKFNLRLESPRFRPMS